MPSAAWTSRPSRLLAVLLALGAHAALAASAAIGASALILDEPKTGEEGQSVLTKSCDVGEKKDELEVLKQLRECEEALEAFAQKTQQGHDESAKQNQEYARQFKETLALLRKLQDYEKMNKAFNEDQKKAMDFLFQEANKAEAEIKALRSK
uniref:Biogenesis of lysosome-related organelles complex 1 subunit 5 n=1 Tax=Alexandrium catenella TaxID=2925 RepID=A0A7S1SDW9_ALECA|mmetsp:Transcript_97165/g.258210  ORF Transcript_97165/g.258210 Transcript_97165/m.258210 type:complete len:152 (+) Transcript_97165:89-544(+)